MKRAYRREQFAKTALKFRWVFTLDAEVGCAAGSSDKNCCGAPGGENLLSILKGEGLVDQDVVGWSIGMGVILPGPGVFIYTISPSLQDLAGKLRAR